MPSSRDQLPTTTSPPNMTTFNSQTTTGTTSSSYSAHRFDLNERSTSPILVYKMRSGYEISSQERLVKELDAASGPNAPHWRCAKKPIPRGTSRVEVQTRDLFSDREKTLYKDYPNQGNALASCAIPRNVFWRRLLLGEFKDMYILSPDSSPDVSVKGGSERSADGSPIERVETPGHL
ncbi:hypothetical protein FH972_023033 [Carpinus fangiana]|uniref:Uncharacterized protein n=1 Tax=Carpinus fangiana TaxID=176857 RepID=A0A5N6KUD9_9ROSI|nr:hypothetical protein FH972_023033 [Carpinus fangiana]